MNKSEEKIEELSSKLHDIYMLEAKRQGDVRHKDKYEDLTENIKEFDRVLARYIIELLASQKAVYEKNYREIFDEGYKLGHRNQIDYAWLEDYQLEDYKQCFDDIINNLTAKAGE